MKEILVTGGSGYVGSHVVRMLKEHGYQPIIIDLQAAERMWANSGCLAYVGDINNQATLHRIFDKHKFNTVIHLAGSNRIGESVKNPLDYYRNNVNGSAVLLEACKHFNVKQVIFSSTSSIYGEIEQKNLPTKEWYQKDPIAAYSSSKLAVEHMLRDVDRAYGIRSVSLRYFNASGACPDGSIGEYKLDASQLIPSMQAVIDGDRSEFVINGINYSTTDGSAVRDFTHVWDIANAHIKALEYLESGQITDVFNIGAGEGKSVIEMFEEFQEQMDTVIPLKVGENRSGDIPINYADISKAYTLLGWKPERSTRKHIVADAIRWYSSDLYKSLKQNEKRN